MLPKWKFGSVAKSSTQTVKQFQNTLFRMKLKNLIKNLGDQFNIPVEQLRNLNLEDFVETAIKVEQGEVENLRDQVQFFIA